MRIIFITFALISYAGAQVAVNDSAVVGVGNSVGIAVLENDSASSGSAILVPSSLQILTQPTLGSAVVDSANRLLRYTHPGSTIGTHSFTYRIQDSAGLFATAQVNVTISNQVRLPLVSSEMPPQPPPQNLAVVNAFPGLAFASPLGIVSPRGETQRVFILEKGGSVRVITNLAAPSNSLFFDLRALVNSRSGEVFQTSSEQGLLGLAFHPNYASNGHFAPRSGRRSAGGSRFRRALESSRVYRRDRSIVL